MKTGLVLGTLLLASCTAIYAETTKAQEPATDPAAKSTAVPAEKTADKAPEVVTVAANKLPGKIITPPETQTSCPTISGDHCPYEACVDPEGGPGDVCHKTGCTTVNTGLHGCQGDDDPFICPPGKTIWVSSCNCQCLSQTCGQYGSWYCR